MRKHCVLQRVRLTDSLERLMEAAGPSWTSTPPRCSRKVAPAFSIPSLTRQPATTPPPPSLHPHVGTLGSRVGHFPIKTEVTWYTLCESCMGTLIWKIPQSTIELEL